MAYTADIYIELNFLLGHLRGKKILCLPYSLLQIDFHQVYLHLTAFYPAHFKYVVYERQQMITGTLDLRHILLHLVKRDPFSLRKIDIAYYGIHGGTYIMRHIGQKDTLRLVPLLRLYLFSLHLLLSSGYGGVNTEHYRQTGNYQHHLYDAVPGQYPFGAGHLLGKKILCLSYVLRTLSGILLFVIITYIIYDLLRHIIGSLSYPHQGCKEYKKQEAYPYDGGFTEALFFIL